METEKKDMLTDKKFWSQYWLQKNDILHNIKKRYLFSNLYNRIFKKYQFKTAIEIGGFPGYYSVYLKKYLDVQPFLVDLFINQDIINNLLVANGLDKNSVTSYEADIFAFDHDKRYDLVHSHGFIEHFNEISGVIHTHTKYISDGGYLLITIPNFRGFNGWIQKKFNPENYYKHNINCMDILFLQKECEKLQLEKIDVRYYGGFSMWLDNFTEKSFLFRSLFKIVWAIGKVISKILPFESKNFSPYIVIEARKPV